MRTVGAFDNDFENLESGYIVVGIEEENGMPKRPVYGFPTENFDKQQGTGIPTIKKALENNGSQPAYFDTDGVDRRFFIVTIPIHPDFIPLTTVQSNQDKPENNQDNPESNLDVQKKKVQEYTLQRLKNELFMPEQSIKKSVLIRILEVLEYCVAAKSKIEILQHISLSKQSKNFHQYLEPMISKGLIEDTQHDKPTSKHQKYFTTSKGKSLFINNNNA